MSKNKQFAGFLVIAILSIIMYFKIDNRTDYYVIEFIVLNEGLARKQKIESKTLFDFYIQQAKEENLSWKKSGLSKGSSNPVLIEDFYKVDYLSTGQWLSYVLIMAILWTVIIIVNINNKPVEFLEGEY